MNARFFRNVSGTEPVREWVKALGKTDRYQIGEDIRYVQTRFPHVGLPVWRSLKGGLFEVRSSLSGNRIARVLVCFAEDQMVLLHAFIKKSQKPRKSTSRSRAPECGRSRSSHGQEQTHRIQLRRFPSQRGDARGS